MNKIDWSRCSAVERSQEKVSGAWVFRGTRVPVKALFENLEDGATIDDFLHWFPGVSREQVASALEFAEQGSTHLSQSRKERKVRRVFILHEHLCDLASLRLCVESLDL